MRKKIILRLSILTAFMVLLWSCRNEDFAKSETNPQRNNSEFFKHKSTAYAKNGTDYIRILEDYNKETDFLSKMPDQKGMPIWEKMYAIETENGAGIMIPLSHDNESMSSILFVNLDEKSTVTGVRDYDNSILRDIVYNQKISKENREQLFLTFMFMDNRTFGNEFFIGIPKDMFIGQKSDDEYGVMWLRDFEPSSKVTTQQAGRLMIIETCFLALHCTHHGPGICDAESGCTECGTTFCNYTVVGTADDPFPTIPGGGAPGGGGGCNDCTPGGWPPSGPNVPENPCGGNTVSSVFYRPAPGCGGGTIPEIDDPCEKTKNLLKKQEVKDVVNDLENHLNSSVGGEKGWRLNKSGPPTQTTQNSDHSVNFGNPSTMNGGYHNHTGTKVDIFSATDIATLIEITRYQSLGNANNAFMGLIAPNGIHYVIRFSGNHSDLPANAFNEDQQEIWNFAQFAVYRDLLKDSNFYSTINGEKVLNNKGLEQLFFKTIEKMNLQNRVILQKVDDNNVSTINKNSDGTTEEIPCP